MSILNEWAVSVAKGLHAESDHIASLTAHGGERGSAREAVIRQVLAKILPENFEIGTGQIVDSAGNRSRQIDVVIARRDFPKISLPSGAKVFLIESVLATIEVKSMLTKEELFGALDNCASVGRLAPNIVGGVLEKLAAKRGLKRGDHGSFIHSHPMETARFDLIALPPTYIFGFNGYESSPKHLTEAIAEWVNAQRDLALRHFPAVVCTKGCYMWRNSIPFLLEKINACGLVGTDPVPLRLLVMNLLYTLIRKIPPTPDFNGLVPNLDPYLKQMELPRNFQFTVGYIQNDFGKSKR